MYTTADIMEILSLYFSQALAHADLLAARNSFHAAAKEVRIAILILEAANMIYEGRY